MLWVATELGKGALADDAAGGVEDEFFNLSRPAAWGRGEYVIEKV